MTKKDADGFKPEVPKSMEGWRFRSADEAESYGFNRQIYIDKLKGIAQRTANSPGGRWYLKEDDVIVERILENPYPFYDTVDFYDDSDIANNDLKRLFVRLYTRLDVLAKERDDIKKRAAPSTGRDYKIAKIDKATKYLTLLLKQPTCTRQHLEKLRQYYGQEIEKLGSPPVSVEVVVSQKYSESGRKGGITSAEDETPHEAPFSLPTARKDDAARLICRKGNEYFRRFGEVPTAIELKQYMCESEEEYETAEMTTKGGIRICGDSTLTKRQFQDRYARYLKRKPV